MSGCQADADKVVRERLGRPRTLNDDEHCARMLLLLILYTSPPNMYHILVQLNYLFNFDINQVYGALR